MVKNKFLPAVAFTGALLVGGVAGAVLGVPGVSGAQTTTVPNAPSTTVPGTSPAPHDGKNCPNMGGGAPDGAAPSPGASAANTGFRRF